MAIKEFGIEIPEMVIKKQTIMFMTDDKRFKLSNMENFVNERLESYNNQFKDAFEQTIRSKFIEICEYIENNE